MRAPANKSYRDLQVGDEYSVLHEGVLCRGVVTEVVESQQTGLRIKIAYVPPPVAPLIMTMSFVPAEDAPEQPS